MDEETEIFDVVDDHDEVVGSASRGSVHRQGLKHRSVHLLAFNQRGEVLLQKRSKRKDTFPNTWDSTVSGHVDSGESYDQAVIRESLEEMGIEFNEVPEKLFKISACEETGQEFCWIYQCHHEGPFFPNEDEVSAVKWFSVKDLENAPLHDPLLFSPSFSHIWRILTVHRRRDQQHLIRPD